MDDTLKKLESAAIENLRIYLRIPSVHPNIDYEPCLEFLKNQAEQIGLTFNVYRPIPYKPHAVLTWIGKEPDLPSIILNSHMDVVPVFEDKWSHKPFDADIDEKGNIYARGVQDTKTLGIQYLEAIRRLKQNGFQPKRTVHVTFVSEEELGGGEGVKLFVQMPEFKKLNAGFAIDEGIVSDSDTSFVFFGEKVNWKFLVRCTGQPGHGSLLLDNTAGEKVQYVLSKVYKFRTEQKKLQGDRPFPDLVTTINLTMMSGGVQSNVIPPEFTLTFDARVPVENFKNFEEQIKVWCKEAGSGVTVEDQLRDDEVVNFVLDDTNIFWAAFKGALQDLNISFGTYIFPANTDGRYFRIAGVPTIGFSPTLNTPIRAHDNDEVLNVNQFLQGIDKFIKIITAITNA